MPGPWPGCRPTEGSFRQEQSADKTKRPVVAVLFQGHQFPFFFWEREQSLPYLRSWHWRHWEEYNPSARYPAPQHHRKPPHLHGHLFFPTLYSRLSELNHSRFLHEPRWHVCACAATGRLAGLLPVTPSAPFPDSAQSPHSTQRITSRLSLRFFRIHIDPVAPSPIPTSSGPKSALL